VKFARSGVAPDLAAVHFIARAITPPGRPRRFDTRFFAVDADAIAARIDGAVGPNTELVELVWLPIEESLKLDMPGITMAVLEELKIRTAEGFTHDLPVPFYRMQRGRRLRDFLDEPAIHDFFTSGRWEFRTTCRHRPSSGSRGLPPWPSDHDQIKLVERHTGISMSPEKFPHPDRENGEEEIPPVAKRTWNSAKPGQVA
jgi:hypothetical protein